jgi:virginiamycin B lyase
MTTAGVVTRYSDPSIQGATNITVGSDGALWFTNEAASTSNGGSFFDASIGRITTSGVVTNYSDPSIDGPIDIAAGSDGALWYANQGYCIAGLCGYGQSIGRITTSGVITTYSLPLRTDFPNAITAGPDGNLWFTDLSTDSIGCITTSGTITTYTDPSMDAPDDITTGPDGALWFTNLHNDSIGRITSSGAVTNFTGPTINQPTAITSGSDGALWFTNFDGHIGRITTSGAVSDYADPAGGTLQDIAPGPDGALWFTNSTFDTIGRISVP